MGSHCDPLSLTLPHFQEQKMGREIFKSSLPQNRTLILGEGQGGGRLDGLISRW